MHGGTRRSKNQLVPTVNLSQARENTGREPRTVCRQPKEARDDFQTRRTFVNPALANAADEKLRRAFFGRQELARLSQRICASKYTACTQPRCHL